MGLPTFVIRENNSYINKQIINTLYTTIPINNATLKKKKKKTVQLSAVEFRGQCGDGK